MYRVASRWQVRLGHCCGRKSDALISPRWGHSRPRQQLEMSAAQPDINAKSWFRRDGADIVAKVGSCRATNFSRKHKQKAIADLYNLNRITEAACEFNVRRRGPSHLYTKVAPAARRIIGPQCKTTFATQSPYERTAAPKLVPFRRLGLRGVEVRLSRCRRARGTR